MRANLPQYRAEEEIQEWRQKSDPIKRFEDVLTDRGCLDETQLSRIRSEVDAEIIQAIKWAEGRPEPPVSILATAVGAPRKPRPEPNLHEGSAREATYVEALNEAMRQEMERDEDVIIIGEDIGRIGGIFGVTRGLLASFGPARVLETPIAEQIIAGSGVGAALAGMRPIVEIQIADFATLMMDMIVNQAAKLRFTMGGKVKIPIVFRCPQGGGIRLAAQHSQCIESWFLGVPGLTIVTASGPYEAKGLLIAAIRDDNPVVFLEHKFLYLNKIVQFLYIWYNRGPVCYVQIHSCGRKEDPMKRPVVHLSKKTRKRLRHRANKTRDRHLWRRYQIILKADEGKDPTCTAEELDCSRPTVYAAIKRWCACGEAGLIDRREDNRAAEKITEEYRSELVKLIEKTPRDYGKQRPSWRLGLISQVMEERTGIKISNSQLSRVLRDLGARWGRSRPIVLCPWKKAARNRRIGRLNSLAANPAPNEVVVYEDEVDVNLNPKIGYDWMMKGQQKKVVTPGKNVKNYIAGALDPTTGQMVWVRGERKNSLLFIDLLRKLLEVYSDAVRIHIILDRYSIHHSQQVKLTLKSMGRRIKLHFLPPYSPDANPIERKWKDFHGDVTTNHQHDNIDDLMAEAERWLHECAA